MEHPRYEARNGDALYTVDAIDDHDEAWTLEQIVSVNEPATFSEEDLEALRALEPGQSMSFGGGAAEEWTIKRVK